MRRSSPLTWPKDPKLRTLFVAVLVTATVALAGCGGSDQSGQAGPSSIGTPAAADGSTASAIELAKLKKQAGIAACPTSDQKVAARPDGLPDVTLDCLGGGGEVRLAGLRGTPTVINIWAQWCRPCRQEAPHLAALSAKAGDKINFLGIDYDDPDPAAAIEYAGMADWSYPQLQDQDKELKAPLKILGPPQTIFVDADGKISYRHNGPYTSDAQLEQAIRDHLGVAL
ncbi:MAG TPA: TlpA disulfide reductase family protein [Microlunatus sp.]